MTEPVSGARCAVLILGLGNVLLTDDGLGAAAVARVERDYLMPDGVLLADGGTLGLALLDLITEADHVVIVDAVRTGAAPGTLVRLTGADVADAVRDRLSVHQVGVADLLDAASLIGRYPQSVALVGLVPGSLDLSVARTPEVEAQIGALVDAVLSEVSELGFPLLPAGAVRTDHRPISALARHFGM